MKEQIKYIISTLVIISITVLWVNAWNWLIASNWDSLDATKWNQLVWATTPAWAVMAFNLASCPTWWIAADWTPWTPDLRWTFVRWIWWDLNWRDISRTLWDYQEDEFKSHSHNISLTSENITWVNYTANSWPRWRNNTTKSTTSTWWTETRPKNIALLYCQKL